MAAAAAAAISQNCSATTGDESSSATVSRNGKNPLSLSILFYRSLPTNQLSDLHFASFSTSIGHSVAVAAATTLSALNQLSCNPHSTTSPKVSPTTAADQNHHHHPPQHSHEEQHPSSDLQSLHSQLHSSPQHHSKHQSASASAFLLTSGGVGGGGVVSGSARNRNRSRSSNNNNQSNHRLLDHREENNEADEVDEEEEELEPEEEDDDNGSDNNISVTSCSPVTVRREPPVSQRRPETSSIDDDNEATNIIITNNASSVRSPSPGGCENGLLRRKSQLLATSNRLSVSPVGGGASREPTTVGAFTSLIQRNSDTLAKHAANHYLKTSDLLAGFSSSSTTGPTTVHGSAGSGGSHHQSSFNPSLAAQLFLQTSQPLLPPPSQWLYTQLYGANYGDFSWFRNSLSGSSAFRSVSAAASLSPESSGVVVEQQEKQQKNQNLAREESDGERSLDRMSPPVTSTSKRSPSPDDGNGTEEEADVIRAPMAKKIDTLGAFTRATTGTAEKQTTSDVWRPY